MQRAGSVSSATKWTTRTSRTEPIAARPTNARRTYNVPSGDTSTYLAQQALPASLYYGHGSRPVKPEWWNSSSLSNPNLPWPAIGPEVSGGDSSVGGHAHDIAAKQCFDQLDLAGGGLYSASLCYDAP